MQFRPAAAADIRAICDLLNENNLPSSDVADHLDHLIVAEDHDNLIAMGGYEDCGQYGLIRSFAVRPEYRGQRLAETIFAKLTEQARASGKQRFYLLTTTADAYFSRLGFVACHRDEVPDAIRSTQQFSDLCPASATVMCLDI